MPSPRTSETPAPRASDAPPRPVDDGSVGGAGERRAASDGAGALLGRLLAPVPRAARPVVVQFLKFGVVGISNTLITFAVYTLLLKGFGVWYLAASAIGFVVGAVNGFLLNRAWTFRGHVGDSLTPVRWGVVQTSGLALNEGLLFLWVEGLGIDKLIAQALAIVIVTTVTFFINRAWTFRTRAPAPASPPT
jgi:putative flippase GtrA